MLFEKEYREAEEKLYNKGFYVENMVEPFNDCYEVLDGNAKVLIDHLSLAQLQQLSNML